MVLIQIIHFTFLHAFNEELAMLFEKKINEAFDGAKVVIYPLSPAFITHGRPWMCSCTGNKNGLRNFP
mgnify:CR=1 FL=1